MSVKSTIDYYNSSGIQVGDIVILDEEKPQDCEGERIAEPYTRLRVVDLMSEGRSVSVKLETEQDAIPLTGTVDLTNKWGDKPLQKADSWLAGKETAYRTAEKKGRMFGTKNSGIAIALVIFAWVLVFFLAGYWVILKVPETTRNRMIVAFCGIVLAIIMFIRINTYFDRMSEMHSAQKKAAQIEKQLRQYRQANAGKQCPGISNGSGGAVSVKTVRFPKD